jgi:hypothetical protein
MISIETNNMSRKVTTIKVCLPNGEDRLVLKSPDYETRDGFIYSPRKVDGESGYGVCFENLDNAVEFMFQQDCKHNIINNTAVSIHKNSTPLPFKCSICNKHFYTKI